MQKSEHNQSVTNTRQRTRSSTTLNRKYVKRPEKNATEQVVVRRSQKVQHFRTEMLPDEQVRVDQEPMQGPVAHPLQAMAKERMAMRGVATSSTPTVTQKLTAKEIKDREIKKALASATQISAAAEDTTKSKKQSKVQGVSKVHFGFGRVLLAMSCAAVAVFAIVYFVNLNMPDLSLRVAAMQTGIDASYPSYVPRDYSLSDITSEDGKVTLNFKNSSTGGAFSLVEESSSWDSNALLVNYVTEEYGDDYVVIKEQGLTLYIKGSDACWVNGGVVFKLKTTSDSLTKKQIKGIATSL